MLGIRRVLFIPEINAKTEADARGAIKKIVNRRFTREDKKSILQKKGVSGKNLDDELERFIPEIILPNSESHLISNKSKSYVIESESLALSYSSGRGPEDPHWHPDEVETYLINTETKVAYRSVDHSEKHRVISLSPGRVIFPARTCHFTDLRGFTEVMSFRQDPAMKRINCRTCYLRETGDCSGLEKINNSFQGEKALVTMAIERQSWLAES